MAVGMASAERWHALDSEQRAAGEGKCDYSVSPASMSAGAEGMLCVSMLYTHTRAAYVSYTNSARITIVFIHVCYMCVYMLDTHTRAAYVSYTSCALPQLSLFMIHLYACYIYSCYVHVHNTIHFLSTHIAYTYIHAHKRIYTYIHTHTHVCTHTAYMHT